MGNGILSGLRVIDCGTYIAAPAAATVLSDFGADVIKIERPPHGDPYRYLSHMRGMPVSEHLYCWILDSRNKKSIALDLTKPAAREALLKLVQEADVFVTNYQPALIRKFRLGYDELRALNPRLVYASLTGYGESGAEAGKPGYDMTAYWARSGLMATMHNADAEPAPSVSGFGDHPTAMALFGAIMLGLYQRERTGLGSRVSSSLLATGAWSNSCFIQAAMIDAPFAERRTRKTAANPLVNHYVTRDHRRFIFCCLDAPKDWPNLCRATGLPELIDDERFHCPEARERNSAELVTMLDEAIAGKDMHEWTRIFGEHDIIFGLVPSTQEVANDEQMVANGVFVPFADSPVGGLRTVSSPIQVDGTDKVQPRFAPEVGEHTVDVLRSAGYSEAEIQSLLDSGAAMAAKTKSAAE